MSRLHLSLIERNPDKHHHRYQQLFQQQQYVSGDLSELINVQQSDSVWQEFQSAWQHLLPDQYMGDGGGYRQRRYSVFDYDASSGKFEVNHDQHHFQALNYNSLNGGIYREYPPFEDEFLDNPLFHSILVYAMQLVQEQSPGTIKWRVEGHQFRIVASSEESGKPTPEGIHQDGRDYVFIVMVDRKAIKGGSSRVYSNKGKTIMRRKMRNPLEFMFINDRQLLHYVTDIRPLIDGVDGHRDVLVLTFRKAEL